MKGATRDYYGITGPYAVISIHAPMKGATHFFGAKGAAPANFNPRTHEGCDITGKQVIDDALAISIHAPMQGATQFEEV